MTERMKEQTLRIFRLSYNRIASKGDHRSLRRRLMAILRMAHRVLGVSRKRLGLGLLGAGGAVQAITIASVGLLAAPAQADTTLGGGTVAPPTSAAIAIGAGDPGCSTAVGSNSFASIVIGCNSSADVTDPTLYLPGTGLNGPTVIGVGSISTGANAITFGNDSSSHGDNGIAIGTAAISGVAGASNVTNTIAIGRVATATGNGTNAIGFEANASGEIATAIGFQASASGGTSIAMGHQANASGLEGVAIGNLTQATATNATALGNQIIAAGEGSVAIGSNTGLAVDAASTNGVAIGWGSTVLNAPSGIALGDTASAGAANAIAIGNQANASGQNGLALGEATIASGDQSSALGRNAQASGLASAAVGNLAQAQGDYTVALGSGAVGVGQAAVAIGQGAGSGSTAGSANSIAMGVAAGGFVSGAQNTAIGGGVAGVMRGAGSGVTGARNVALGTGDGAVAYDALATAAAGNLVTGNDNIAIGTNAGIGVAANATTSIGYNANATAENAIAMGAGAQATGANSISIGTGNVVSGANSGAFGDPTTITGSGSYSLGNNNTINANNAFVVGSGVTIPTGLDGAVVLGNASTVSAAVPTPNVVLGGTTYTFAGGAPAAGDVVSVGSATAPRQIQNVAAGQISASSLDAINGSQLYATNQALSAAIAGAAVHYYSVNDGGTAGANYNNDGATGANAMAVGIAAAASGQNSLGMMTNAVASGNESISIGTNSASSGAMAIALGSGAKTITDNAIAVGANAQATGTSAAAMGLNASAWGNQSIALGLGATAGVQTNTAIPNSIAIGTNSVASGGFGVAIGTAANATADFGTAIGNAAVASADNAIAMGNGAQATGSNSISIGTGNVVSGANSAAIGDPSTITGSGSYSLGNNNTIDANNAFVVGSNVTVATGLDGAVVLGNGSTVSAAVPTPNVVLGGTTYTFAGGAPAAGDVVSVGSATAPRQIQNVAAGRISDTSTDAINGSQLYATNQVVDNLATTINNITIGGGIKYFRANSTLPDAQAIGTDSVAIGPNAVANNAGDVAVGLNSVSGATTSVSGATIGGTNYSFAGGTPAGAFSVGAAGAERQIQNVAAGRLAADSTDAVNGSQLFATNEQVTKNTTDIANLDTSVTDLGDTINNIAGDTSTTYTDANGDGIRYVRTNDRTLTVSDSFAQGIGSSAVGYNATAAADNSLALGRESNVTIDGGVALGSGSVSDRALAPATGQITAGPTSFIQYNTTDKTLLGAVSVGTDTSYRQITNVADGTNAQDAVTIRQLQGAIASVATTPGMYFHANSTAGDSLAVGAESIAVGPTTVVNGDNGIGIGNGAIVEQLAPGGTAVGQNAHVVLADGVALGTNSTAAGIQSVALGAGATSNHINSVALGAQSVTTVGAQANYAGFALAALQNSAGEVSLGSAGAERKLTNVAAGSADTDGVNVSQLRGVETNITNLFGGTTTVNPDGTITGPTYNIQGGSYTTVYDGFQAVDNSLTNLTNQINGGGGIKYFHANSTLADSSATGTDSVAIGPESVASGTDSLAAGHGATASAEGSVALGEGAQANNANDVALGSGSVTETAVGTSGTTIRGKQYDFAGTAPVGTVSVGADGAERTITNVAAGRISRDSTDAINGSQLYATNQAIEDLQGGIGDINNNAVFYDLNPDGSKKNSITLVGGDVNAPVVISNVGKGVKDTDAVNVAQLNESFTEAKSYTDNRMNYAIESANTYTDQKFNQLNREMGSIRSEARAAAAIGLAAASLRYDDRPGKLSVAMGGGFWKGEGALAFGAGYTSEDGRVRANLSGTVADGDVGVGAGLSFTLN